MAQWLCVEQMRGRKAEEVAAVAARACVSFGLRVIAPHGAREWTS